MKLNGVIVDADFCIKIGASPKYRYLERLLPLLADKVYMHREVYEEILVPKSAREQVNALREKGVLILLEETDLTIEERILYDSTYQLLATVMSNPYNPRKNRGEIKSLAMAKTKAIPYFATDEKELQPIIDRLLNTGINDIQCIRIIDVIFNIKMGKICEFKRKEAKVLWRLAGKNTVVFDEVVWPVSK